MELALQITLVITSILTVLLVLLHRAKGGGLLRGVSLLVNEPAPGIGGPNGPLLTTLTASSTPAPAVNSNLSDVALITQQQNDLSVTGAIPVHRLSVPRVLFCTVRARVGPRHRRA